MSTHRRRRARRIIRPMAVTAMVGVTLTIGACSATPNLVMGGSTAAPGAMAAPGYQYSALTCTAPSSLPGTTVDVTLADMGMSQMMGGTAPTGMPMLLHADRVSVPAGQVTLVASNRGWRTHELVVLPLGVGVGAGQRNVSAEGKVDEAGSLGEASSSCAAGAGEGITARAVGWTTLTLPRGRYELVCNLTNHYADGMHQELDVG